jgi:hypothetical protein
MEVLEDFFYYRFVDFFLMERKRAYGITPCVCMSSLKRFNCSTNVYKLVMPTHVACQ